MNALWLCLRFPLLPLDLVLRGQSSVRQSADRAPGAIAIIDKQRVVFVNAAAKTAGVTPAMTLTSAYALASDLTAVERQPQREQSALNFLANWAYQFTPAVSLQQPDSMLLEIAGSLRLFHGLPNLLQEINTGLQQLGFTLQSGLAHTPKAAIVFSRNPQSQHQAQYQAPGQVQNQSDTELTTKATTPAITIPTTPPTTPLTTKDTFIRQLQQTPLTQLDLNDKQLMQISHLGLCRAGELLALPKASLGKRFGKDFVIYLEKLIGEQPDLQPSFTPQAHFDSEIHFLSGLSTIDMLTQPVRRLLQELHQHLTQRQLHCRGFRWRFFHFDKQASHLAIELSRGQNNPDNFLSLTLLKMEHLTLSSAVETVQLYTDQLLPADPGTSSLFRELAGPDNSDPWFLLDKLRGRLGPESIFCLQLHDENLPELQQQKAAPSPVSVHSHKRAAQRKQSAPPKGNGYIFQTKKSAASSTALAV